MEGVVIYKSKYGATEQYARWIGSALMLPVIEAGEIVNSELPKYDFVILGSSVYIGKLFIKKWLKKNLPTLLNKKVFLFVVSGTSPDQKAKLDGYLAGSLPREAINRTDIHFLPGRLEIKKLSWFDRFMVKMGARLSKYADVKGQMTTGYDRVNQQNIIDLVKAVTKFQKKDQKRVSVFNAPGRPHVEP